MLQRWRILKARPYIPEGSRVLDVGCADGLLHRMFGDRIREYVGIDPILKSSSHQDNCRYIAGRYPNDLPVLPPFNVITMLAVIEHLAEGLQREVAKASFHHLVPNGRLIITTPSPLVDPLLIMMRRLRIIDGMSLEDHYRFDFRQVPRIFEDLEIIEHKRFQLGLNHLFVFRKV